MKYIFELVLITIIIYFVWNILKRIFFKKFHSYMFNQNQNTRDRQQQDIQNSNKDKGLNWDAETVDYEEVKEEKK
ncbi:MULTISPECIES: hypothetical protein [Chryseobacterium]|uniref:Amino acid permease n=1 Tax=Chryseobacterium camelliae TaxID=1265445 RepID=A0ABU0TLF6_9FLAO|nr:MULTISPECIES: hypothetical protein [Chryseobacterium]MDT3409089.1 amino acid permease [Pseudacidovorax intermedius]MDQ1097053.1 amino acid permease [Chryseobacterium camelliae]MDQ1100991.1 amino acid permease [Chryseobacterium sp. SORGH_AS_1048]MDR6084433.1 amino acid permease [Chryseobacterium sp. SORGH_AS_0909]MDR6132704.1 amino acid permease [Chryseobacterium sp. SORGH_AS_1175]